jgi:hypothetical protein
LVALTTSLLLETLALPASAAAKRGLVTGLTGPSPGDDAPERPPDPANPAS